MSKYKLIIGILNIISTTGIRERILIGRIFRE